MSEKRENWTLPKTKEFSRRGAKLTEEITRVPESAPTIPADLMEALMTLHAEDVLSDHVYHVRDSEGDGWNGPRVKAFGDACNVIQWYVDKQFTVFAAEDAARKELERITPPNEDLLKLANPEPNESAPGKGIVSTIKDAPRSKVFQDFMARYFPTGTETFRISRGD